MSIIWRYRHKCAKKRVIVGYLHPQISSRRTKVEARRRSRDILDRCRIVVPIAQPVCKDFEQGIRAAQNDVQLGHMECMVRRRPSPLNVNFVPAGSHQP